MIMRACVALVVSFALAANAQTTSAHHTVADPGVIATGQRTTPAGVQTVFSGKVGGVRFGATSDEIWVSSPGFVNRVAWRDGRTIARARVPGRTGVFSLVVDPKTGHVIASSVGRATRGAPEVTTLSAIDPAVSGDNVPVAFRSAPLGDYMAGGPAIARTSAPNGRRLAVLPLPANDSLAVLDAESGMVLRKIALGVEPIAAAISPDSRVAYVTVLGGGKPRSGERSMQQCCDPRAEAVRVDARGFAQAGNVSRVDLVTGTVTDVIPAGRHPTALAWDEARARLYVAAGNSDSVTVVDTKSNTVARRFAIAPFRSRLPGIAPTALALSPDGSALYIALGGVNAVAMYDVSAAPRLRGLIPTSWYPSSLDASADGRFIAVGSLYGVGAGTGTLHGKDARYVFATRGAVDVIAVPTDAELTAYTTAVSENNRLPLASALPTAVQAATRALAVPARPGDPSLIKHVVFIVRENRTYDQVLGDHLRGAHDSSLVMYGRGVTPNTHALAEQFVTLDHFFASGGNSADGHQWLTQANETDYPMWPLYYGRSYPSEGIDALTYSSGGFLWEAARAKGKRVAVFGEYAPGPAVSSDTVRKRMLGQYFASPNDFALHKSLLKAHYDTHSTIPSLDSVLVREYPGWTEEAPDVIKAGDILAHLSEWEKAKAMPDLVMIVLPNDHTVGTSPGWCSPRACVADNDYALGKLVQGFTHSSFWKDMVIFAVEDDAQDGVDHIDGHRTVALAISPYTRRGVVDSTVYTQVSMVKSIELMLGLPSMSIFDLSATDMRASFIAPSERPDASAFTAIEPRQSLLEVNERVGAIKGKFAEERQVAARQSSRMNFREPDEAPEDLLNRILWHEARGWDVPYPETKRRYRRAAARNERRE